MAGKILLWGAKSQARIVAAELERAGRPVDYLFDAQLEAPEFPTAAQFLNQPKALRTALKECAAFVVCIGGANGAQRAAISERLRDDWCLEPISVISPNAAIDPEAELGAGVQVMAGACIGLAARIGDFAIVNSNATIDHECDVGQGVHVMPAAALAGRISIGNHVTVGTNATVLPDLTIGAGAQIGAGAVVRHDVEANSVVVGVPARLLRLETPQVDLSLLDQN